MLTLIYAFCSEDALKPRACDLAHRGGYGWPPFGGGNCIPGCGEKLGGPCEGNCWPGKGGAAAWGKRPGIGGPPIMLPNGIGGPPGKGGCCMNGGGGPGVVSGAILRQVSISCTYLVGREDH
jgi:hypothetical protein